MTGSGTLHSIDAYINRIIVTVRARVEHPFRVVKRQFGYAKTRYRGREKPRPDLHAVRTRQPVPRPPEASGMRGSLPGDRRKTDLIAPKSRSWCLSTRVGFPEPLKPQYRRSRAHWSDVS